MKIFFKHLLYGLIGFVLFCQNSFAQEERISNYKVIMEVMKDRSIKVKEELIVQVTGQRIKRGLFRSLPRSRRLHNGKSIPVRYNITNIMRDGKKERFTSKNEGGKEVLYIGQRDVILRPGQYHYTIEYLSLIHISEPTRPY